MSDSNQFNQRITDIVSQSTQNAGSIPGLQSSVLNLASGSNRFTPQQLTAGLYPIASSPIYQNPKDATAALNVISQMAQGSGAASIEPLSHAVVGAVSAYGFRPNQTGFVADTIAKGVNIGLAESPDFAKGIGSFSASSLAADSNRQRAFAMSVGAFTQQTNLSPRFRFDAQGENAFFQQATGRQSKAAQQVEQSLNIQGMFGVGAIGRADGLQGWLQQFQAATGVAGADNQQLFMQNIFGRQNALQFARGFTGTNFQSGQVAIQSALDAGGTVARGAKISDSGPQAQWDQVQSKVAKDMILAGDTITNAVKPLGPALAQLAAGAEGAARKLGDVAGGVGLPVVDLLTAGGTRVMPVYFTHGDRRIEQLDGSASLGKAWRVSRLKSLLQTGQILLPQTSEAAVLAKELQDYEIRVDENANDKYGAFKVGTHDDLVTARGLAIQITFRPFSSVVGPTPHIAVNPSSAEQFLRDLPRGG